MKKIATILITAAKENPKDFFVSLIAITAVFVFTWGGLWIAAILDGNV